MHINAILTSAIAGFYCKWSSTMCLISMGDLQIQKLEYWRGNHSRGKKGKSPLVKRYYGNKVTLRIENLYQLKNLTRFQKKHCKFL